MINLILSEKTNYIDFWCGVWHSLYGEVIYDMDILNGNYMCKSYSTDDDCNKFYQVFVTYE